MATQNTYLDPGLVAGRHAAIVPSDGADLPGGKPALVYVGTGGDVRAYDLDGTPATYKNVPAGATLPTRVLRVLATGTTATDLVALY